MGKNGLDLLDDPAFDAAFDAVFGGTFENGAKPDSAPGSAVADQPAIAQPVSEEPAAPSDTEGESATEEPAAGTNPPAMNGPAPLEISEGDIDDIDDISNPGWYIFVDFSDVPDPKNHPDYRTLVTLMGIYIANVTYDEKSKTVRLSQIDGCIETRFPEAIMNLVQKYRHTVYAPSEYRKSQAQTIAPPPGNHGVAIEFPPAPNPSAGSIVQNIAGAAAEVLANGIGEEAGEMAEIPDEITISLPLSGKELHEILTKVGCRNSNELMEKLSAIADRARLGMESVEFDDKCLIIFSKKPEANYKGGMDPRDMAFILILPQEKTEE